MSSSSRSEALHTLSNTREDHVNAEWCNKTQVVKYLFKYVTKGPDWVGSECLMESPHRVRSGEMVKYLFNYMIKCLDWVGSGCLLESPPLFWSGELHSSEVDNPNPAHAPSIATMTDKSRRLPSQKALTDVQSKKKNT